MTRENAKFQRMVKIFLSIVLAGHGLIHLMGFVVYLKLDSLEGLPYKTTLLNGAWQVGEKGMSLYGVLWLLPLLGFLISAVGLLVGWGQAKKGLVGTAILSLIITFLDWDTAYAGFFLNLAILVSLFVDRINQKMLNQFVTRGQE